MKFLNDGLPHPYLVAGAVLLILWVGVVLRAVYTAKACPQCDDDFVCRLTPDRPVDEDTSEILEQIERSH